MGARKGAAVRGLSRFGAWAIFWRKEQGAKSVI